MAKQHGFDLSSFKGGDAEAFQHLLQRSRMADEARRLAEYGQQLMPYASEIQQWLAERQAKLEQQRKAEGWSAPAWDQSWLGQVEYDEVAGEYRAKAGYPPDLPARISQFREHQRGILDKLASQGFGAFKDDITKIVEPLIAQHMQQGLSRYKNDLYSQQIVHPQRSPWMFQLDQQGGVLCGFDGWPALSQEGQMYFGRVQQLHQMGITDARVQDQLAREYVIAQAMMAQMARQGQPGQPAPGLGEAAKQQFLQQAQTPPGAGYQPAVSPPALPAAPSSRGGPSLEERLKARLAGKV